MPGCAAIGCVNRSGKNPSLSFHQIPSNKRKEIRQEWLRRIKRIPAGIYVLKVSNNNTRTRCEICSKLRIKGPERRHWRRSGVFILNFEHIPHLVLVFLLLTLNRQMPIENFHVLANFQVPKFSLFIL